MFGFRNWVTFSINFLFLLSFVTCGKRGKKGRRFGGKSPSWISVKKAEETYELNATHLCHGGAWLPDPIFVDCVCVRGIWALSTDFCDRNTTIYTGDGHCFQIKKKIRKLFNLDNDKTKPFEPGNYLINTLGNGFQTVKKVFQFGNRDEYSFLLRINPRHPMFHKSFDILKNEFSDSECLPSVRREYQNRKDHHHVLIAQIFGKNHFSLGSPGFCSNESMPPYWTLKVGQSFRLSDQLVTEGKVGRVDRCPTTSQVANTKSENKAYYFYKKGNTSSGVATIDFEPILYSEFEFRPKALVFDTEYDLDYDYRWPVEDSVENQIKQLDSQTKRMGSYFTGWMFYGRPGPKVKHVKEFAYLQFGRKLLIKTSKNTVITVTAINHLFRWFRWLWRESLDVYSYNQWTHADQHTRILNALQLCYDQAEPFKINYNKECQIVSVEAENDTFRGNDIVLPENYRYDISHSEASLEFMYKMMMHVHHYCSGYFSKYPTDHSTLNVAFESILSPLLRLRWKNPGSTLSLMRSIWPRIQLQPIFEALDAIVGASHTMSDYKDLMERPIEEDPLINPKTRRKKRSVMPRRTLWNRLGYCVEDTKEVQPRYGVNEDTCK